jgi:hypothetical protein
MQLFFGGDLFLRKVRNKIETARASHLVLRLLAIINETDGLRRIIFGTAVGSEGT